MGEERYEITLESPRDGGALIVKLVTAWSFEHARQKAKAAAFKKYGDTRVINWRKAPLPLAGKRASFTVIDDPEAP